MGGGARRPGSRLVILVRGATGAWVPLDLDELAALAHAYWPGRDRQAPDPAALAEALATAVEKYREVR